MANPFTQEAFTLLGIGALIVLLRGMSRIAIVGIRGLWIDDYLMVLAAIIYGLETGTAYVVGAWYRGLANNSMTDEYRANLGLNDPEYQVRVNGSKTQLVGWSLYTLLLWLLKLCMCIFFTRLTEGMHHIRWRVRSGYIVVAFTYIATICSILLGCHPFHRNWQINPDPGNHCQPAISHIDLYVTVVLNVVSDAYLLSIPVALFWKAGGPWTTRLAMVSLFSGAIFVMAAACLRCALIIQDPVGGAQAAGSWAVRESFVALVVSNIPIIYQGYRKALHPCVRNSIVSIKKNSTGGGSRHSRLPSSSSAPSRGISLPNLRPVGHLAFRESRTTLPPEPTYTSKIHGYTHTHSHTFRDATYFNNETDRETDIESKPSTRHGESEHGCEAIMPTGFA